MRKITAGLFISLDGVVEAPEEWHFPYFNEEMGEAAGGQLTDADTLVFGRETYDSFAGSWPGREAAGEEDADFVTFTWRNSEQLQGDLVEAVTALKNEPSDRTIAIAGSISVVRQLLAAGLLDELHLLVHPIAVRKGMRLFDEGDASVPLELTSSKVFDTGVVYLVYQPDTQKREGGYEEAVAQMPQND
jgi:dihydrofolate reductase